VTPTPIRIAHPDDVPPLPSATPAATLEPTRPAPQDAPALEQLIRDRLGADASHYAVVVEDLSDGRRVAIDPDRVFYAASLFKLEVMYDMFDQRDAGVLNFAEQYIASDHYASFGLGPRRIADCQQASIQDLLAAMMSVSDNVAAVMLQDRAGAQNINNAMADLGLTQTRLTEDGSLPATAADMALLVEAIARGDAVSSAASTQMRALMANEEVNDRIPHGLPDGTLVEHKTGNWDDATHDAGIVHGTRGTYVMVVMSDIGFDGDAGSVEADIAKIAFDYFEQ
jgi:beta-lactamase class A